MDGIQDQFPLTWLFLRNTSRWTFNSLAPGRDDAPEPPRELLDAPYLNLPEPTSVNIDLLEAIRERHTCRQFSPSPVPVDSLSTLLKYTYGLIGEATFGALPFYERPVPSGGGMYPLDLFAIVNRVDGLATGVYRYAPANHGLETVRSGSIAPRFLTYLCMGQDYAASAAVLMIIGSNLLRSMKKYGDRGYRYILLEAGHAAQNINLLSAALNLGNCNIGGFYDVELATLLRMDLASEAPLYCIAIGVAQHKDREASRAPG